MLQTVKQRLSEGKTFRIAFVGDSLTSTEWVHPNWREIIEYVLKQEMSSKFDDWKVASWQIRTINAGFDGATSRDILTKLDDSIVLHKPNLVILMIGGNDKYFFDRLEAKENLKAIIEKLKAQNIQIALSTDPALFNKTYDEKDADLREIVRSLRDDVDIFIDLHKEFQSFPLETFFTFISEDGNEHAGIKHGEIDCLHPNVKGNAYIAKVFLKNIFQIDFEPEIYLEDVKNEVMFPRYSPIS